MEKITKRQFKILEFIRKDDVIGNKKILEYLANDFGVISRITLTRDLGALIKLGLIERVGLGRNILYKTLEKRNLLKYYNPLEYFETPPDERKLISSRFVFDIFDNFQDIISPSELKDLNALNKQYTQRIKKLSPTILKKEFERLTIELSWKSSRIEGNTYSLVDTEILIKKHKEAAGHKKEEAIMIMNHKKALDYISGRESDFKKLTLRKIEDIHRLAVGGLGAPFGIRKRMVGITGTAYRPIDNEYQIKEAISKMIKLINNKLKDPFSASLAAVLLISYIQPFEDGNKRTARLLGNAVLIANNACPLSYRSVDEADYKKAMLLFYEQNSAKFFKELFIDQFKFAVDNYFLA